MIGKCPGVGLIRNHVEVLHTPEVCFPCSIRVTDLVDLGLANPVRRKADERGFGSRRQRDVDVGVEHGIAIVVEEYAAVGEGKRFTVNVLNLHNVSCAKVGNFEECFARKRRSVARLTRDDDGDVLCRHGLDRSIGLHHSGTGLKSVHEILAESFPEFILERTIALHSCFGQKLDDQDPGAHDCQASEILTMVRIIFWRGIVALLFQNDDRIKVLELFRRQRIGEF